MTPQTQYDDAAARKRIRTSLDESLIVEASAGTGKTSELIRRIVAVLASGRTEIDKIVAVTFTHKAAGELKLRLRQELDNARAAAQSDAGKRLHLEDALERLEEASIGTIHSFCAQILRQRPVEAVVDPAFAELTELEGARLYERAFRGWLQRKLNEPAPGLRRALTRLAWRDAWDARPPVEQLQETGRRLIEWRDFPAPWRREPFDREKQIDALVLQVRELASMAARSKRLRDNLVTSLRPARDLVTWIDRAESARARDYDTVESLLLKLQRDLKRDFRKGGGVFAENLSREAVLAFREQVLGAIEQFRTRADADLAAELRGEMQDLLDRYGDLKRRSGKLDFLDLLIEARKLVRGNAEVRAYLQRRFTHIFVDEFQDTDPIQAEILLLLAASDANETDWLRVTPASGKLFVVGDPKQSIYKFRRADVVLYEAIRQRLEGRGVGLVHLTRSFRAVRPIQECVNAAFAPEMTGADGQARYAPLEEHSKARAEQPCVVVLPAPRPYGMRKIAKTSINACLPDAIVAFIEWLLKESQWQVRDLERPDAWVPVSPRHICVLFRRFTNWGQDLTHDYVRGLEARGISHLLVGSKSFHRREEVETMRAALAAIEWPEDELSVFATLKGSLFAIPDSMLLRFRHEAGHLDPVARAAGAQEFETVAEALRILGDLHRGRNRRPIAETVNLLLEATRAHAGFALRPAGHQVLANVYRICELARSFETSGGISFRGFVEELEAQSAKAESAEAPVLEEDAEGVRLMTVHTAKGLEFAVVILADMTANLAAQEPERHVDAERGLCATRILRCAPWELLESESQERARESAEGVRVAYVAATRARDLLVVPAVGDEECGGWVSPLNKAIYPAMDKRRKSAAPPGCPKFGESSVVSRPSEFFGEAEFSVKPGLHQAQQGAHRVVWWDPNVLQLQTEPNFGLSQEDILLDIGSDEGLRQYRRWEAERDEALRRGRAPRFTLITPSEALGTPEGFTCAVESIAVERATVRPAGRRFGTLVHEVLRDVELADVPALVRMHGRLLGASIEEMDAALEAATVAVRHPVFERARNARQCHREWPVLLKLDDRKLLEGVIDLAFLDGGEWTIVDFKTDADVEGRRETYVRQLQWYALAVARITNQPVRACLLQV